MNPDSAQPRILEFARDNPPVKAVYRAEMIGDTRRQRMTRYFVLTMGKETPGFRTSLDRLNDELFKGESTAILQLCMNPDYLERRREEGDAFYQSFGLRIYP